MSEYSHAHSRHAATLIPEAVFRVVCDGTSLIRNRGLCSNGTTNLLDKREHIFNDQKRLHFDEPFELDDNVGILSQCGLQFVVMAPVTIGFKNCTLIFSSLE